MSEEDDRAEVGEVRDGRGVGQNPEVQVYAQVPTLHGAAYLHMTGGDDMVDGGSRVVRCALLLGVVWLLSGCAARPKTVFDAAADGDLASVRGFMADGADVNAVNGLGQAPLHLAAENGRLQIVAFLLDHGARVDSPTALYSGTTALSLAAWHEHLRVVDLLLSKGASANAADRQGRTPLHFAARSQSGAAVQLLVNRGADVNARDRSGATPLHAAVVSKELATAEEIIRCGADVSGKDRYGYTPLHYAVRQGDVEMARLLTSKGSKIDLFIAAGTDDVRGVRSILQRRGGINEADGLGYTALHWAAQGGCVNAARLLIAQGAALDARTGYKMTPLHAALCGRLLTGDRDLRDRLEVARTLILAGADLSARDRSGRTALGWADYRGYVRFGEFIASRGGGR